MVDSVAVPAKSEAPFSVLRLRPVEFQSVGPTRERLGAIGSLLSGHALDGAASDDFPAFYETVSFRSNSDGVSLAWQEFAADLVLNIRESLAASDSLLIDLSYGLSEVNGIQYPDRSIAFALDVCAGDIKAPGKKIVLIHSGEVTEVDGFVRRIESAYSAHVLIANTGTGDLMSEEKVTWAIPAGLSHAVLVQPGDVQKQLENRVVRRRGVFQIPGDNTYEGFRYSAEQCEAELLELIPLYFERERIDVVIYDSSVDIWFKELVKGAAVRANIELCQSTEDIERALAGTVDSNSLTPATLSEIKGKRICLVIPMLKSGHNAWKLRDRIEQLAGSEIRILAALANPADDRLEPGFYTGKRSLAGTATRVSYFGGVHNLPLDENSWIVEVAGIWGEVHDPRTAWDRPSRVGMLALLEELGAHRERNVPRPRAGIAWFPGLAKLGTQEFAADALWLAECLIRVAVNKTECKREDLLILVPDDNGNGAQPIGRAMKDHLDVHVVVVPRTEFGKRSKDLPPRLRRAVENHASESIVLFDESAVSYGTFVKLAALVTEITGDLPAVALSVVEAKVQKYQKRRPRYLHSFYAWRPATFVDRKKKSKKKKNKNVKP